MIDVAFTIGNLNKEHGGAQQLLFDICRHLPDSEFDTTVYYMFGEGTYEEEFEKNSIDIVELKASSNYDIFAFHRLTSQLKDSGHDILQTNSPISGIWGRLAAHFGSIPCVVSVEHSVHTGYPLLNRLSNGITLPLTNAVVGVSDAVIESLLPWERLLLPDNIQTQTIYNGVDVGSIESEFSKKDGVFNDIQISQEKPIIGTVGRFKEAKGFKYLIRAFSKIKKHCEDAQLLLIGGGDLMYELKEEAEVTGYEDDIYFTGLLSNVYPFLPNFDIAVFPSLWEGFGLTPVESMVAKCPVVATDIPAFREVIGDAGVLVEPANEEAIANAVISLLKDPSQMSELGQAGYERAIENFLIERTVEEYANLYRELVNE